MYSQREKKKYLGCLKTWYPFTSVLTAIFPTEKRPWALQAWLPPRNKLIWVQRLVAECLLDIT